MYQSGFWPAFGHKLAGRPADQRKGNQVVYSSLASTISYLILFLFTNRAIRCGALALLALSLVSALSGCGGVTFNSNSSQTGSRSTPGAATLTMISCGVQSLTGAQTRACSVYLSAPATNATSVSLTSSNPALVVPASVVVPVGAKAADFNAVTEAVNKSVSVTITAKANGVTETDIIALDPVSAPDPAPALSGLSCATQSVTGPTTISCSVSLSAAATAQTEVMLSTSSSNTLKAPQSVSVAAGKSSADFNVTASAVSSTQKMTLTATMGAESKSESILIYAGSPTSAPAAVLSNVSCGAQTLTGPTTESCAVYLSAAATSQTTVMLSSSSSALLAPASVNIAVGKTTAAFSVTASAVSTTQKATLTATAGGVNQTDVITLSPAPALAPVAKLNGLSCGTQSLTGAQTKSCYVTLSAATASQVSVALASSSGALQAPASVTVAIGASSAGFNVTASAVSSTQKATLTATAGGVSQTDVITLYPTAAVAPALSKVSCVTQTLVALTTETCAVYLSAPATSSTVVQLSSSNTALQVPTSVTVPTGSASVGFNAIALSVTSTVTATLTATVGGVTQTEAIQLEPSSSAPAVQHSVQLSWNAPVSSSVPVVGYNVYRSTAGAGAYDLLNSSVDANTSYPDTAVQSGQSYDYVVKSVDSAGAESPPSNITNVTIP